MPAARADSSGRRNTSTEEVWHVVSSDGRVGWSSAAGGGSGGPAKVAIPGETATAATGERAFWRFVAKGVSSEDAAVGVGVSAVVGTRWFRHGGGMPPLILAEPTGRYLSFTEREEIALLKAQDVGVREIARRLCRDPGTISRELRRNTATRAGQRMYRASVAQWKAELAARRPKPAKLAVNPRLREYVQDRLAGAITDAEGRSIPSPDVPWKNRRHGRRADRRWGTAWSPEQISHRLRVEFPDDVSMRISHEAIYQALYVQGRGALRRELTACLRTGRALREPRARSQGEREHQRAAAPVLPQGH